MSYADLSHKDVLCSMAKSEFGYRRFALSMARWMAHDFVPMWGQGRQVHASMLSASLACKGAIRCCLV